MNTRVLFLSFLIVVALIAFVGCSDDDSGTNTDSGVPAELVGTWGYDSITVNSARRSLGTSLAMHQDAVKAQIILNTNSTERYDELNSQDSVVYYYEGNLVVSGQSMTAVVTSQNGIEVTPYTVFDGTWGVNGTHLMMTMMINAGDTVRSYLTKQ